MAADEQLVVKKLMHDLKSPLTALRILRERSLEGADEQRLLKLTLNNLENLLALTVGEKLGSDPACHQKVQALCEHIVHEHQVLTGTEIKMRWEAGVFAIDLDTCNLRRIFDNLVSNGIRAANACGGHVQIRIWQDLTALTFEIVDGGPGLNELELQRLKSGRIEGAKGWGVGLMIVRELVEIAGGRLEFSSKVGLGTRARVRFPIIASR